LDHGAAAQAIVQELGFVPINPSQSAFRHTSPMRLPRLWHERIITPVIKLTGYSAIIFVVLILVFLLTEGLPTVREVPFADLLSQRWYPIESYYGLLPLLAGSLLVTIGATIIALPLGIGTAIFVAEIAPRWLREILKPFIEIMAGVPSVVLGFIGFLAACFAVCNIATGLTAQQIDPPARSRSTIVSVAKTWSVRAYRDAALAIGANQWHHLESHVTSARNVCSPQ
jgi:phosphate transport system permease protein